VREKVIYLGGSSKPDSIGKQCTVFDIIARKNMRSYEYRLMVDCGMEFVRGEKSGPVPNFSLIKDRKIDCVILTHGHTDHTGGLGALRASGLLSESAPVISSPQTAHMLELNLRDGERSRIHSIFDTANIMKRRMSVPKPGLCEVLPGLVLLFAQNGHLSGSASIVIPTGSGKNILVIGDTSEEDQPITQGRRLPSEYYPASHIPDCIGGTDFTYGFGNKTPLSEVVLKFQNQVRADIQAGKKVVAGVFRAGRGQNVPIWLLDIARELNVPIWLDGSTSTVWNILRENPWSERDGILPELGEKNGVIPVRDSMHRMTLLEKEGPAIFVTTPGMADFRPLVKYLEFGLPRKDFSFYFTSWIDRHTNANRILSRQAKIEKARDEGRQLEPLVKIFDEEVGWIELPMEADVHHFGLGAHGDSEESIRLIDDIVMKCRGGNPLEFVLATHGSLANRKAAAERIYPKYTDQFFFGEENTIITI